MNSKLSENAFQELHKFLVAHNLTYIYIIVLLISGLLFFLGWIFSARKSNAEIRKLKSEIDADLQNVVLIEKINKFVADYVQKDSSFQTLFNELIDRIKDKDKNGVTHYWSKVNNSFTEMILSFYPYFNFIKQFYVDNEFEKRHFVNNAAIFLLRNTSDYKLRINSDEFMQFIGHQNNVNHSIIDQIIEYSKPYLNKERLKEFDNYVKIRPPRLSQTKLRVFRKSTSN